MASEYSSDILIIGTGGAGLRAAVEAHERGLHVILVSKAPAGYNNCTIVAGSGYLAAVGGMSVEEHRDRTLSTGKGINDPQLVDILVKEGGKRVLELEKYGLLINIRRGGINVGGRETKLGQGITLPMVDYLKKRKVDFVENTIITKLLRDKDRLVGAVGYNSNNKEPLVFQTKAIILATGGAGALYKRTDCPLKTTGDGYTLAFQAGARLRDMEFVQFFPLALAEPGFPSLLVDGPIVEEGKIINVLGEDIPEKHCVRDRPFIAKSRDLLSRAMMKEIIRGDGVDDAVLIDGRDVISRSNPGDFFGMGSYEFFIDELNADERPFRVAPICHHTMGGVVINSRCETGVKGLYAAGEVVGGIHGANRHGGNALTDVTVFGARAGIYASEYVESVVSESVEKLAEKEIERYMRLQERETGYTPETIMNLLRENMWENAGIVRDSFKLVDAYERIQEIRTTTRKILARPGRQMMAALEVPMALDAAEIIVRAAMARKESRGAHYRSDHPEEGSEWLKTIVITKEEKAISIESVPVGEAFDWNS
jgi:succinate dehydrogenase/fumarate reductase flavoprotein subunit